MRRIFFVPIFLLAWAAAAEDVPTLLAGFLENDLQLKKYSITEEKKSLALKSAKVSNGVIVELSTGTMKIQSSSDRTKITVTPQASVEVPALNGLKVEGSVPVVVEDGKKEYRNGSVVASAEIVGNSRKKRQVALMEAERALLEARRDVRDRALSAEKDFYSGLKTLYKYAVEVLDARENLYDDSIDLRVLAAQGYSKTSAAYRQKNLKVESDRRNVREKQRILERETQLFAKKCGIDFRRIDDGEGQGDRPEAGDNAFDAAIAFLPGEIPDAVEANIFKFDKSQFSKIEKAKWNALMADLKRRASGDLTLRANAGYVFSDSFLAKDDSSATSDAVTGGISLSWRGIEASAGVGVPNGKDVLNGSDGGKDFNPYYTLSLTVRPTDFLTGAIDRRQDELDVQLEQIELSTAEDDYDTEVLSATSSFHDLKWNERSYAEEFKTYDALEADMARWLRQGSVTESDWLSAKNNKEKSRINILINRIEQQIFSDEIRLLFVDAEEK